MPIVPVRAVLTTVLLGALSVTSACVEIGSETPPSRFYVLSSTDAQSQPSATGPAVLLGPVILARYLDRPQIVTRPSPNQLDVAEYDRWGGRLDDNFARVLAQNLGVHLNTSRIAVFPRDQRLPDAIQASVDVSRFERVGEQGDVELDAQWTLYPADRRMPPFIGSSRIKTPAIGSDFAATVSAMSTAVDKLAQDIAAAIRKMPKPRAS